MSQIPAFYRDIKVKRNLAWKFYQKSLSFDKFNV